MLTNEELKNILVLIQRSNITGAEALAVAQLQMKINGLVNQKEKVEAQPIETNTETPTAE